MDVLHTIADFRAARQTLGTLAFVPTMGALHDGHLSLMRQARQHAAHVAVSIFVNPTQFGPNEDFTKYPRPTENDLAMCESVGVDVVFNPSAEEMYPPASPKISIDLPHLTNVLEGAHRPGHFAGVCQIVAKLFNVVQPTAALFGQKDFQQLRILTAMVEALDFPIRMIGCATVREADGLAMSSRNRYLNTDDRRRATAISRSLFFARDEVSAGRRATEPLLAAMHRMLVEHGFSVDYLAAVDPLTLSPVAEVSAPTTFAIAARIGGTRLIDNLLIQPA